MNRHRSRARSGYTLVFFAMFLFGFMALAALVIDIGFARLTQRQMQTAVDAAALEGLRFRDLDEVPDWLSNEMLEAGVDPEDAENPDYARRWLASRIVAWTFDDNLDPSDGDEIGFGAGPVVDLGTPIPGAEDLNAGQLILPLDTRFYKPVLQLNLLENERHGDMVAGRYTAGRGHHEYPNYERDDFEPDVNGDSFLVRMRRSNDFEGLDNLQGVSSHEFPIPYLFGRGAFFPAGSPNRADGYSPRHHGMTVRATAIADGTNALSAGRSRFSDQLVGTLPFAIERSDWENAVPTNQEAIIRVTGATIELYDPNTGTGRRVGFVIAPAGESALRSLGDLPEQLPVPSHNYITALVESQPGQRGYVVLIGDSDGAVPGRVVGFGYVDGIGYDGSDPDPQNRSRFVMTKRTGRIAAENASAVPVRAVDPKFASKLIEENRELADGLLVPINRPTYGRRRQ